MTLGRILAGLGCLGILSSASASVFADLERPTNFVLILADDLGWGDLGCYGNPRIRTPNLDALASEGTRLTDCYSACGVCSPSRSGILTGRTPYRNGVYRWIPEGSQVHLRTTEVTLPELLRERGYATCHVGKWHLNGKFNSPEQPQPGDHGFDHWMATQNNASPDHLNPENFVVDGEATGRLQGDSAHLVVGEAVRWLRESRPKDRPFYLQVWTHEPHLPIQTDPRFLAPYADLANEPGRQQHHGNVSQLDDAVGVLLAAIREQGLDQETFVFFTSDNGPEGTGDPDREHPGSQKDRNRGSTGGLRGRKRDCFEGGIRVPGIARWPGRIVPAGARAQPVIGTDVFVTFCNIAGATIPGDRVIDGGNLMSALGGKPVARARPLYSRTRLSAPECRVAMRDGDWKIVGDRDLEHFLLFDLAADAREEHDLSAREPAVLERMRKQLLELNAEIFAEGPTWWKGEKEY